MGPAQANPESETNMSRIQLSILLTALVQTGCAATGDSPEPTDYEALAQDGKTDPAAAFDLDFENEDADPCQLHCRGYTQTCGPYFEYDSYDECEALCPHWEETKGTSTSTCRIKALGDLGPEASPSTVLAACEQAGPNSETCGSAYVVSCDRYCEQYVPSCSLHAGGFLNDSECMDWCGATKLGIEGDETGDTVACRLHWLDRGDFDNPATYCGAASPNSPECG